MAGEVAVRERRHREPAARRADGAQPGRLHDQAADQPHLPALALPDDVGLLPDVPAPQAFERPQAQPAGLLVHGTTPGVSGTVIAPSVRRWWPPGKVDLAPLSVR